MTGTPDLEQTGPGIFTARWQELDDDGTTVLDHVHEMPKGLHDAFMAVAGRAHLDGYRAGFEFCADRLVMMHKRDPEFKKKSRCAECGTRWPCATLRTLGIDPVNREEEQPVPDNEQPVENKGIVIETKEGGTAATMQPSTTGTDDTTEED